MIDSGALPAGWSLVPLGELLTAIDSGKSFKCEERPPEAHEVGVIKVSAVSWGEYQESESKTCVDADRIEPNYFVRPGDFLFSRANTIELVGACVIAGRVSKRLMLSDKILRLHFAVEDLKPWVLQYLRSKAGRDQIEMLASGNQESMRNIGQERLRQILVPLPPSNEREFIGFKLDELLTGLAVANHELSAAKRKVVGYRQSLLKSAVEGAITAQWRSTGAECKDGATLLQRVLHRRQRIWRASRSSKYVPPLGLEGRALFELPRGWVWTSIDEVTQSSSYGTSTKCDAGAAGTPVLRIPNLRSGHVSLSDLKYSAAPLGMDDPEYLRPGDVLIVRTNGSISIVGNAACVPRPGLGDNFYFASYLLRLRPVLPRLMGAWITAWLRSPPARQLIEAMAASSAGQHNIGLSALLRLPIPIAPVAEMRAALGLFSEQSAACESHNSAIALALKMAAAQRQNILRAAFSGQLVPQDPNDEPASVLLDRIRAQSQAAAPAAKRKPGRPAKVAA